MSNKVQHISYVIHFIKLDLHCLHCDVKLTEDYLKQKNEELYKKYKKFKLNL